MYRKQNIETKDQCRLQHQRQTTSYINCSRNSSIKCVTSERIHKEITTYWPVICITNLVAVVNALCLWLFSFTLFHKGSLDLFCKGSLPYFLIPLFCNGSRSKRSLIMSLYKVAMHQIITLSCNIQLLFVLSFVFYNSIWC